MEDKTKIFCYAVVVVHNTGHGELATVIHISRDELPTQAVIAARMVEEHGYEFYSDEAHVSVFHLEENVTYPKSNFEFSIADEPPEDYPVLFIRRKKDGEWEEEWFDKDMEKLFRK